MADKLYSGLGARPAVLVTDILAFLPSAGPPAEQADITALFSDASSVLSIDRDNRLLINSSGGTFLDFSTGVAQLLDPAFIDQPNRLLIDSSAFSTVDWDNCQLIDNNVVVLQWNTQQVFDSGPVLSGNWGTRRLFDSSGTTATVDWEANLLTSSNNNASIDWENRILYNSLGVIFADFSTGVLEPLDPAFINQASRKLIGSSADSVDWEARLLIDSGGVQSIDWENRLLLNSAGGTFLDFSTGVADFAPSDTAPSAGTGSPEGVVAKSPGAPYLDTVAGSFYVKQTGTGDTGWLLVVA